MKKTHILFSIFILFYSISHSYGTACRFGIAKTCGWNIETAVERITHCSPSSTLNCRKYFIDSIFKNIGGNESDIEIDFDETLAPAHLTDIQEEKLFEQIDLLNKSQKNILLLLASLEMMRLGEMKKNYRATTYYKMAKELLKHFKRHERKTIKTQMEKLNRLKKKDIALFNRELQQNPQAKLAFNIEKFIFPALIFSSGSRSIVNDPKKLLLSTNKLYHSVNFKLFDWPLPPKKTASQQEKARNDDSDDEEDAYGDDSDDY